MIVELFGCAPWEGRAKVEIEFPAFAVLNTADGGLEIKAEWGVAGVKLRLTRENCDQLLRAVRSARKE